MLATASEIMMKGLHLCVCAVSICHMTTEVVGN